MMMKKFSYLLVIVLLIGQLSGCGFTLRGYHEPIANINQHIGLKFGNELTDITLKNILKEKFQQLTILNVSDSYENANIQVKNIELQKFQLVGILTEIRMVMSADVSFSVLQDGKVIQKTQRIQAQRSYQYDQASVNIDNPQAEQIQHWLYDNLAQQIADQYFALQLSKASP